MSNMNYNLITMAAFIVSGVAELIVRSGGGFTLAALIFYGLFHIIREAMYLLKTTYDEDVKRNEK